MRRQDRRKGDEEKENIIKWRRIRERERERRGSGVRVAAAHPVVKCKFGVVLLKVRFEGNCDCVRV
jgi:hypothetical protein